MRFASGGSHFGFLLVDLARFIQLVAVLAPCSRNFARPISGPAGLPYGRHLSPLLTTLFYYSPLGGLPDVGNLDQGG